MTTPTLAQTGAYAGPLSWLRRAEGWLDDRGRPAWIAAMILGFVFCWPAGLALLGYMIWSKRMFGCSRRREGGFSKSFAPTRFRSSGNSAFDAYKADTIDRLEREQEEFEGFLRRLRESKDKAEFDQYMDERARAARDEGQAESQPPAA
ncbi:DUF2852 domain-containing protein [Frigidibacter sp. MR17.14]|uniref:DUF2852 domain-containing protein n=1 Tax=Frigidibacter sp. MR17.14 TaxID=3126509 RepID=UPI003012D893